MDGEVLITIIAIVLSAGLMIVFPVMTMADRTDDISQAIIETATTEFVDNVRTTGKLTLDQYSKFVEEISSTGNSYDVEMEIKVLDENPGKKTTQAEATKIGENVYYSKYTSQILDELEGQTITLKEGDIFMTKIKNSNTSLAQQLKNVFYSVSGSDTYTNAAEHAGICTANGSGN